MGQHASDIFPWLRVRDDRVAAPERHCAVRRIHVPRICAVPEAWPLFRAKNATQQHRPRRFRRLVLAAPDWACLCTSSPGIRGGSGGDPGGSVARTGDPAFLGPTFRGGSTAPNLSLYNIKKGNSFLRGPFQLSRGASPCESCPGASCLEFYRAFSCAV